jgi:hypothetical protein
MIVDKVRNATTRDSAVHYEVTMRIWPDDLKDAVGDKELSEMVRKAIDGIAMYPMTDCRERTRD